MSGSIAPNLYAIVDALESGRETVAARWIKEPTVKRVFKVHKISGSKFQEGYGVPIIEYFISVVREEKEAGDCPIMSRLVRYLLERDITPKDVFDICMGLRRSLTDYLFEQQLVKDPPALLGELATLFDANLSGVMGIFGELYAKKSAHLSELEEHDRKLRQIFKIINFIRTKILILESGRLILANQSFFETIGTENLESFRSEREDPWSFIDAVDDEAELFAKDKVAWLQTMCDEARPFKVRILHAPARRVMVYSGRVTMLPDTAPVKYIMTLHNIDPYMVEGREQEERLYRDSMTGFFNFARFEQLAEMSQHEAQDTNTTLALTVIDLPDLKDINEVQGRESGDTTVMEIAQIITTFVDEGMILGRFEGSRFGILRPYETEQGCYDWATRLCDQLNKTATRCNVSLTAFSLTEPSSRLFLRGFDLADLAGSSEEIMVRTDMDVFQEKLPNQTLFHQRLERMDVIESSLYYKGIAVSARNNVLIVEPEGVWVTLSPKQLSVVSAGTALFFAIPQTGYVTGKIESVDYNRKMARIYRFRSDRHSPLMRKKVRVEASGTVKAGIFHEERELEGIVLDLNDACIALSLVRKKSLDIGCKVSLSLTLQSSDVRVALETPVVVQRIERVPSGYKVVFVLGLDHADEGMLSQYIASRQMELIQELKRGEA